MNRFTIHLYRLMALAAGVVVAATTATAGLAVNRPDDRNGVRGGSATLSSDAPDFIDRYLAARELDPYVPDAVDRYLAARAARSEITRPDDRGGLRGDLPRSATAASPSSAAVDFQWDDAGIGAATLALALLVGASGLTLARRGARKSSSLGSV